MYTITLCTCSSREASAAANVLMSEAFCFVQTEDGKVVSVQHNPTEKTQIVNYKKGIAAAFQANFKKTEVEIEEDTQSTHHSRYRLVESLLIITCTAKS